MGHEVDLPIRNGGCFFVGWTFTLIFKPLKTITPFAPNNISFNAKSPSNSPPKVVRESTNIEVNLLDPPPLMIL
jgi:hypothetical protein